MKKAIAMKCSQEDWDSIKGKLEGKYDCISSFGKKCYLVNNYWNTEKHISNSYVTADREIHETFNAKIFLEACGIEFEKKFEITKEQIISLHKSYCLSELKDDLEMMFPKAFKKELELNKWYKSTMHPKIMIYPTQIDKNNHLFGYGLDNFGKWIEIHIDSENNCLCNSNAKEYLIEATPQEVETALINEAKKRGFKNNTICIGFRFNDKCTLIKGQTAEFKNNTLTYMGCDIFKDGKWTTIIETITIQEAEKLLNKKIV